MNLDAFLTDAEWQRLDAFLLKDNGPENAMDISMLHGFLTAVASGPKLIMPSEWLPWVWDMEAGQGQPVYSNAAEAEEILGLIMRLYQEINGTLNHDPKDFCPTINEREYGGRIIPIIDEWCVGYYQGMALDMVGWRPLFLGKPDWFSTIVRYGTQEGWELLQKRPPTDAEHQACADGLAETAQRIHAFWLEQRQQQATGGRNLHVKPSLAPLRRDTPKMGRNDPCHCGSGRKYKHCHGAH